jgi:RNA polymerase sigma factor (sigma-70 family)
MAELNDMVLLEKYGRRGSEEAFANLVTRHVNLVYSVALRRVQIPAHAEEITQAVFVILAQKAGSLGHLQVLEGWLHETTRLIALSFLRRERRRQLREQKAYMESSLQTQPDSDAWKSFAPLLDEGMAQLNSKDRDALILRFFKDRTVREVAEAMGLKENAAQQRILRAVDKLRLFFSRRGVVVPAAAVTAAITAHSVQAAPGALAHSVTALAVAAKGTAASASTLILIKGALKTMAWTKSQSAIAAGVIALSLAAPFFLQHTASAKLRAVDDSQQQQAATVSSLRSENERLSSTAGEASLSEEQLADLRKLRTEMAALKPTAESAAKTQAENSRLRQDAALKGPIQLKETMFAKVSFNKDLLVSFYRYAAQHDGQFPTTSDDAAPFLDDAVKNQNKVSSDQFEIVFTGSPSSITNAEDVIALREKNAFSTASTANPQGNWAKVYGFVDGHVIVHSEPENNFTDFEKAHMISPASNP